MKSSYYIEFIDKEDKTHEKQNNTGKLSQIIKLIFTFFNKFVLNLFHYNKFINEKHVEFFNQRKVEL